ncbi:hypothetical protein [Variovorax boronicumulans]|uniref:hypothetical protein n=1 Tax=Variovorax boronicumulans TaxID=436515 RepID=UPI00339728C8
MNLLRKLAASKLPCTEAASAVIDELRVLEAAGHIKVLIPPTHMDCDDCLRQDAATVFEVTPRGWKALSASAPQDEVPLHPAAQASRPKAAGMVPKHARAACSDHP